MLASLDITYQFVLVTTISLFTIVNPLGATTLFVAHAGTLKPEQRRRAARRASMVCGLVLTTFAITGQQLFAFLGVSITALKIAGAFLIFTVAFDMLRGKNSRTKTTPEDQAEAATKEDISLIPIGVPLLAGPGAITTVMVLMFRAHNWAQMAVVIFCIFVVCLLTYIILASSSLLLHILRPSGVRVMTRLMGIILASIAVQFVINGIKDLLPEFGKLLG